MTILIVQDNDSMRPMIKRLLGEPTAWNSSPRSMNDLALFEEAEGSEL